MPINENVNLFWKKVKTPDRFIQNELIKHKILYPGITDTSDLKREYLILIYDSGRAIMVFKVQTYETELKTVCVLFINHTQTKNVPLISEASRIAKEYWPHELLVEIEPGKINSPTGYCFKLAGWTNLGRNTKGNFIYSNP